MVCHSLMHVCHVISSPFCQGFKVEMLQLEIEVFFFCYQRPFELTIIGSLQHILSIPHLASARSLYTILGSCIIHSHEHLLL